MRTSLDSSPDPHDVTIIAVDETTSSVAWDTYLRTAQHIARMGQKCQEMRHAHEFPSSISGTIGASSECLPSGQEAPNMM